MQSVATLANKTLSESIDLNFCKWLRSSFYFSHFQDEKVYGGVDQCNLNGKKGVTEGQRCEDTLRLRHTARAVALT